MNDFKDVERRLPQELIDRYKNIHPAELGHVIEFGVVSPDITPVLTKPFYFVGSAVTCRISPVCSAAVYDAIRRAHPGDVLVIDMQGEKRHSCWGEIVTICAKEKGMVGGLVDGPVVDSQKIIENDFPVLSRGRTNLTTKFVGFRSDVNIPVTIGGVNVNPGDLVLANEDGAVVIAYEDAPKLISIAESADAVDEERQEYFKKGELYKFMQVDKYLDMIKPL
ncbi:RraA family protein [Cloacibacillus evryensis]|uniref:RraA family protein n=1 Tax=Cloacibacillus evryensis TaxID=508460 RepID=UPI00241F5151|nr:RraA family protein [Cloacibacillus evryensis]